MKVKASIDAAGYSGKPVHGEIVKINRRIAKCSRELEVQEIADLVGNKGHTFCPAVFSEGKRKKEHFLQMQLFGLDFDTGVSFDKIKGIAKEHELPIAFAYQTFSSTKDRPKFRVVFVHDVAVDNAYAAEIMLKMLFVLFPDTDKSCKDVSRMFFGGKGVLGKVEEKTINIMQLAQEFQRTIFELGEKNYNRAIHRFAKQCNVACIDDVLQIKKVQNNGKTEDKTDSDQYIYGSITVFPSETPKYVIFTGYQKNVRTKNPKFVPVKVEKSDLKTKCRLYQDFKSCSHIPHNHRFLLLLNLMYIEGGMKIFHSIIEKKGYDKTKWRFYAKYAKDNQYKPQSCSGNCPYDEECPHETNMLLTVRQKDRIVKLEESEDYVELDEVYQHVSTCLEHAVESSGNQIVIIPAQTALGKTEAYCNLIRDHPEKKFIVAVPTNQLKYEVYQRLKQKGVDIEKTLSLCDREFSKELKEKLTSYFQWGLGKEVISLLKTYIKENKENEDKEKISEVSFCEAYVKQPEELKRAKVIVTTHARLVLFSQEMIEDYCVIIDEDILSTFFKNVCSVSMETVKKVSSSAYCPRHLRDKLRLAEKLEEDECLKLDAEPFADGLSEKELRELEISDNVNSIAYATVCCKRGETLYYFYPSALPVGKCIVLSATADAKLYRKYFKGREIVECAYKKAKYQGKLTQLSAYSMSRQCIQNHKESLKAYLQPLQKEYQMITFKKYEEELNALGLHFGNAEGVDRLSGKNLIIVGTPHLDEMIYRLIGCHLGIEIGQEVLAVRKVRANGYEFNFMTYNGEELRGLQFYFIHKELEQCIGRARLLRNDCKVLVLSNFPCEQAELIQEDYLKERKEDKKKDNVFSLQPVMAGNH